MNDPGLLVGGGGEAVRAELIKLRLEGLNLIAAGASGRLVALAEFFVQLAEPSSQWIAARLVLGSLLYVASGHVVPCVSWRSGAIRKGTLDPRADGTTGARFSRAPVGIF